jgi:hypothetical protein
MSHLRILDGSLFVVADDIDSFTELIGQRTVKVRCQNPRCLVVVAAGKRCGSCNRTLDGSTVVHNCVEDGHRRTA